MKNLILIVVFISLTLCDITNSRAQAGSLCEAYCEGGELTILCPDDADPITIGWHQACVRYNGVEICPGKFCDIEICYCWRETGVGYDYSIRKIFIRNPCPNCDPNLGVLLDIAFRELFRDNPATFPCPQCDPNNPPPENCGERWWREVRGLCWKEGVVVVDGQEIKYAEICEDPGWCFTSYCVCCVNDIPSLYLFSQTSTGPCTGEGCQVTDCPEIWP